MKDSQVDPTPRILLGNYRVGAWRDWVLRQGRGARGHRTIVAGDFGAFGPALESEAKPGRGFLMYVIQLRLVESGKQNR